MITTQRTIAKVKTFAKLSRDMKNILIVEDEFIIAILIEKQINKLGYNVIAKATNGQKTIDIVK